MNTVPADRHYERVSELLNYANGQVEERRALSRQLRALVRPINELESKKDVVIGFVLNEPKEATDDYYISNSIIGQKYDIHPGCVINWHYGRWIQCTHFIDVNNLINLTIQNST